MKCLGRSSACPLSSRCEVANDDLVDRMFDRSRQRTVTDRSDLCSSLTERPKLDQYR